MSYIVSCHCGHLRLEVDADLTEVSECNCSICVRSGFLHWYVRPEQVKFLSEKHGASTYWWRSATGGQHFCPNCGNAILRTSLQYPPPLAINARCVEGIDLASITIRHFDGKHAYP